MGADLIMDSVPYIREGFEPNWKAGFEKIDWLTKDGQILEDDQEFLEGELDEFKDMFNGSHRRDVTVHEIGPYDVILTGGMSWGDSPTELSSTITNLEEYGILEACGFYDTPDYNRILGLVLDKVGVEVLPLLMNLDPDLDKIVKEKLKGE
jgi:hypothetical protein